MANTLQMWFKLGFKFGFLQHSWNIDKSTYPENCVIEIDELLETLTIQANSIKHPTRNVINHFTLKMYQIMLKIEEIEKIYKIEE